MLPLTLKGFCLWTVAAMAFEQGQKDTLIFGHVLSKYSIKVRIEDLIQALHNPLGNFPAIFVFCNNTFSFYFGFPELQQKSADSTLRYILLSFLYSSTVTISGFLQQHSRTICKIGK